jgi:hypothetical protein
VSSAYASSTRTARRTAHGLVAVGLAVVVAGCSSGSGSGQAGPTSGPTQETLVDGIPVPTPYVSPTVQVVDGPATCPAAFGSTLTAVSDGARFTVATELASHLITCRYARTTSLPFRSTGCTSATILVNTEPQAYNAFSRWVVETGQNAMWTSTPSLAPRPVGGLGIRAEWVPGELEVATGSSTTWVSVSLTWTDRSASSRKAAKRLAKRLAAEGLAATA